MTMPFIERSTIASDSSMLKTRIMYVENKSASLNGPARIGRVTLPTEIDPDVVDEYWRDVRGKHPD